MDAEKWLKPENLKKVTNWAKQENLSIAQIAKKMKISARNAAGRTVRGTVGFHFYAVFC